MTSPTPVANVWFLAPVCTSFCSWAIHNGGTRTRSCPGGKQGGLTEAEVKGNAMAEFAAQLFEACLRTGKMVLCENPAPDGRYPKIWDLPCWQRLLQMRRPLAPVQCTL